MLLGIGTYNICQSQTSLDFTTGFNYSKIVGEDIGELVKFKPGFYFGVSFNSDLYRFYFKQNLIYCRRGFRINKEMTDAGKEISIDAKVNINSIDLPIILGFRLYERFSIYTGLQFEYMYSTNYKAKVEYEGEPFLDYQAVENIINVDKYFRNGFSALGGINYQFDRIKIGLRYLHGITPISLSHNRKDYNMLYQFTINYELFSWNENEDDLTEE